MVSSKKIVVCIKKTKTNDIDFWIQYMKNLLIQLKEVSGDCFFSIEPKDFGFPVNVFFLAGLENIKELDINS